METPIGVCSLFSDSPGSTFLPPLPLPSIPLPFPCIGRAWFSRVLLGVLSPFCRVTCARLSSDNLNRILTQNR